MVSETVQMVDLNPKQWLNLASLFQDDKPKPKKGTLYLMFDDTGRVIKCVHSRKGRLPPEGIVENKKSLKRFKERYDVRRVIALRQDALQRVAHFWQKGINLDMDYALQWLTLLKVLGRERNKTILTYPSSPNWLRLSSPQWLERLFRLIFPEHGSIVFVVFENNAPYASLILGLRKHSVDLITTLDYFGDEYCPPPPWQKNYKEVLEKIKTKHSRAFFGLFAEKEAFELLKKRKAQLRELVKQRRCILDPLPSTFKPLLRFF